MEQALRAVARAAIGFMPEPEGLALYEAALTTGGDPLLEIGGYCGKSAVYLGAAAAEIGTVLYSIDHHRGSEEQQPGEAFADTRLIGADGRVDTLPAFIDTLTRARLRDVVLTI